MQAPEPDFDSSEIDEWVPFLLLRLNIINWTNKKKSAILGPLEEGEWLRDGN